MQLFMYFETGRAFQIVHFDLTDGHVFAAKRGLRQCLGRVPQIAHIYESNSTCLTSTCSSVCRIDIHDKSQELFRPMQSAWPATFMHFYEKSKH